MEVGSAVARSSSRATRPCAADAAPPRYPHVREEASRSGQLDPRERPRAWARRRGSKQEGGGQGEGLELDPLGVCGRPAELKRLIKRNRHHLVY